MEKVKHVNCGRYRPLLIDGNTVFVSRGYDLLVSNDNGNNFEFRACLPVSALRAFIARSNLPRRVFREGFHALVQGSDGALVGVVRGAIVYCPPGEREMEIAAPVTRGSRPLNVCYVPGRGFYFGEYFSNPDRDRVRIYGSSDGREWSPVYTFPSGSIRHVHGIYFDPFREGIWVLTGDSDEESGLWFTADGFLTLEAVVKGKQNARAVSILPVSSGLIVPMDSPETRNYVQHLDVVSGRLDQLAELTGSVFYATRVRELMLVSTVVEPSQINIDQRVTLYAGSEQAGWHAIARYPREFPQFLDLYLQYPSLILAPSNNDADNVFAYGMGVKGLDGLCLRWSCSDIREFLTEVV